MEEFDLLECGFNNADETINFGTRVIGYENLYEISTLACVKPSQSSGSLDVSIYSLIQKQKLFISVNNCIRVFQDLSITDLLYNGIYEEIIDLFYVTPDDKYLIIGLRNGSVTVHELKDSCDSIFTECLQKNDSSHRYFIGVFLEICNDDTTSITLISYDGLLIRLSLNFNQEDLREPVINMEKIHDFKTIVEIAAFNYPLLAFTNGKELYIHETLNNNMMSASFPKIKTICPMGGKFLALLYDGTLLKICALTLLIFPVELDTLYDNICVVEDKSQKLHIFGVTKKDELGHSFIQLLSYPDFTIIYSLKLSHSVVLTQPESLTDEMFFISKVNSGEWISELRINCVTETEPELRLEKLVARGKLEEAEIFAKNFNVDPAIITKARAKQIVEKSNCTSEDIDRLLGILDTINDDDMFKLECCKEVDWNRGEDVRKIFNYAATMKLSKNNSGNLKEVQEMQDLFLIWLFRFDTYSTIYTHYDLDASLVFLNTDLFEELKTFLKNCQVEEAIILYSRLDIKTIKSFTKEKIDEILHILKSVKSNIFQPFLTTFIPITLHYLPQALTVFVEWLYGRIFQLEKWDSLNFPDVGIKFAEDILKLLNVDRGPSLSQKHCVLDKDSWVKLSQLMAALKDMQTLKNNFRINVSISEYLMGPKNLIQTLLNVVMDPVDYEMLLKEFLYIYILKNKFDPDEVFFEAIKNLLKYEEEYWVKSVEVILKFISSVTIKLYAVIDILRSARAPWCSSIREIGRNALHYTHDLLSEVKKLLEDEPILVVLKNPKYGMSKTNIGSISELKFVVNRIAYVNTSTIIEDVNKLCNTSEYRREANIILVQNRIKNEMYEEALKILDNNTPAEINYCAKYLAITAKGFLQCNKSSLSSMAKKYWEVLNPIYKRLIESSTSSLEKAQITDDFNVIKSVYKIKSEYRLTVTCNDLVCPHRKDKLLKEILDAQIGSVLSEPLGILKILTESEKIACYFNMSKDDVIISFCENLSNFDIILKAGEYLLDCSSNSKNLSLAAVLLLKYVFGTMDNQALSDSFGDEDETAIFSQDTTNMNVPVNNHVKGLNIAKQLAIKAMINADADDHSAVMEVINWVDSYIYLNANSENRLTLELFKNIYYPDNTLVLSQSLNGFKEVFCIYCQYIGRFNNPNTRYLTYFSSGPSLSQDRLHQEITNLPFILNSLCSQNQHLTVFKLLSTLKQGLLYDPNANTKVLKTVRHLIDHYLPQIVMVVAAKPHLDQILFFNLLSMLDEKNCTKTFYNCLKMYKRQITKFSDMAYVGLKLMDKGKIDRSKRAILKDTVKASRWWKKIDNRKVQYDQFFKSNSTDRLKNLISESSVDMQGVKEYCEDFELDVQQYYLYYLKKVLMNWKPDIEYKNDLSGKKNVVIINTTEELTQKCKDIIEAIKDKELAYKLTQKIYSSINFYYYEVFISIIHIQKYILRSIKKTDDSKNLDLFMLDFLKPYRRSSPPGNSEKEQWHSTFPYAPLVDPLSDFRLPFSRSLFTKDIWDIIRPEINLKTYKDWFRAADLLSGLLQKDDICTYAIKALVSSRLLGDTSSSQEWNLYSKLENLPSDIDACAKNISNLETATAVVYHVMKCMPPGVDKVNVAELSYKYAQRYKESKVDSAEVEDTFKKVKQQYYNLAATNILHAYQLADEKYIHLVANPLDLINALYLDDRILKGAQGVDLSCPDINKAVDTLAQLFGLRIREIRYEIVVHLLNNTNTNVDLDSSRFCSNIFNQKAQYFNNNDNLRRASYICSNSEDISFWQNYLYETGDQVSIDNNTSMASMEERSYLFRASALKVFYAISDVTAIEETTEVSVTELLDFIDKLTLLSDLENLGIVMTYQELEEYNKKDLLKRLCKTTKPISVKIMAALCVTYSIDDMRYWEFIINNAIKFDMIPELRVYVELLKNRCLKGFYINAWQVIVNSVFKDSISQESIYETYINNCLMIQTCPVVNLLNFEGIVKKCLDLKRLEFAAVLSQYLPDSKKPIYFKELLGCQTLSNDLQKLFERGIYGIKKVKMYLAQFHGGYLK